MTLKRLILGLLTLVVLLLVGRSLLGSLGEAQITDRLQLYQTDLILHAAELQSESSEEAGLTSARNALLGESPVSNALDQYQEVRQSAQVELEKFQAQLNQLQSDASTLASSSALSQGAPSDPTRDPTTGPAIPESAQENQLQKSIAQQRALLNQIDVRLGLLQAEENQPGAAVETWTGLVARSPQTEALSQTAQVLTGLWEDSPRILPDAEQQIQQTLDGWFRYTALSRLYQLQQRPEALATLQAQEQETAQETLLKLALVGTVPLLGCLVGVGLIIFVLAQRLSQGKQSILAKNGELAWETPWTWEEILQVLVVGFFFAGQILLPLILGALGISFSAFGSRARAAYALTYYLLMAATGLLVLYLSVRPFRPIPEGWFRFRGPSNWFLWGVGGYFAALPLMIGVSLLNQRIWQGQGGSNPLLQIVLEEGDKVALGIFFFTAAIAAPLFEEMLFRGFLLPSLTRYVPVWGAIALSSLLFAIAHLSLSEVIPLAVLGSILGFIYTRSRSLLAPMLLHSLWNSATMIGLFILGSGAS